MDSRKKYYNLDLNFPTSWSFAQIKDYIKKEYRQVDWFDIKEYVKHYRRMITLKFTSLSECMKAKNTFVGKVVKGINLDPSVSDPEGNNISDNDNTETETSGPLSKRLKTNCKEWRPDIDVWEEDPTGLYGFKIDCLESMGIYPPLQKWVHVTNIRCGKMELRALMEKAGKVHLCMILAKSDGRVMFSHSIEAVQAVIMFDKRNYQGLIMRVKMCLPCSYVLPKGLQSISTGLGINGEPLKDVVKHYERYVKGRSNSINATYFLNPENFKS